MSPTGRSYGVVAASFSASATFPCPRLAGKSSRRRMHFAKPARKLLPSARLAIAVNCVASQSKVQFRDLESVAVANVSISKNKACNRIRSDKPAQYPMSIKIDIIGPVSGMSRPVCCFRTRGGRHLCDGSHDSWKRTVIVCSCNVLSDSQVRSTIASAKSCARLKHVYAALCCTAKCGRCARTIQAILEAGVVAAEAAHVS